MSFYRPCGLYPSDRRVTRVETYYLKKIAILFLVIQWEGSDGSLIRS